MFALKFSDINILLNENIRPESKILFNRDIQNRIELLLPFLQFDNDPYLVTIGGKLYWIRDGYTVTDAYPYSKYTPAGDFDINYIRNSVKVVVDAYTGKVDAYMIQKPIRDPMIETYSRMFPGIFKPISEMPREMYDHIRYPEDLFSIQTGLYTRWHYSKDDPNGFYNNADLWEIPNRPNVVGTQSEQGERMEPYYIIMRLPNGATEEFILMTPFIRAGGRKNMVAWMCAKCDPADYGRLVVFKFPGDSNVYGPQQVAGLASQDTVISQQLSSVEPAGFDSRNR